MFKAQGMYKDKKYRADLSARANIIHLQNHTQFKCHISLRFKNTAKIMVFNIHNMPLFNVFTNLRKSEKYSVNNSLIAKNKSRRSVSLDE